MKSWIWNLLSVIVIAVGMAATFSLGYLEGRKDGWKARHDIAIRQMEDSRFSGGGDW